MGRFFRKYRLILWKNYLVRKRHWLITILEVLIPIILFLLIALLRAHLSEFKARFVEEPLIYPAIPESSFSCDEFNIIYSPDNQFTRSMIKGVSLKLSKTKTYPCSNEDDMEVQFISLKGELYTPNVFGVVFEDVLTIKDQPLNFNYKIRPGQRYWYTDGLTPIPPEPGPMDISDLYINNCFTKLQLALDKSFIQHSMASADDSDFPYEFFFQRFPYPPHVQDSGVSSIFNQLLPFCTYGSFLMFFAKVVKRIVEEKATGAKELMCMMGMSKGIQWLGWLSTSVAVIFVDLVFIVIFLNSGFKETPILRFSDGFLVFLFLFLYCLSSILLCFAIAAFFSKENIAFFINIIVMILTLILPVAIGKKVLGLSLKMFLSLLPNVGLHYGFEIIGLLEERGIGLQWYNLWSKPSGRASELTMGNIFTMFLVEILICGIMVWYLDRVRPGKFGMSWPWYFPIVHVYAKLRSMLTKKENFESENEHLSQHNYVNQMGDARQKGQFEPLPPGKSAGIQIRGVRKIFGKSSWFGGEGMKIAVNGVSLDILRGEITALLGHNGAGKTTLISILTGIYSASEGKVMMDDHDIEKEMDAVRESLGLCPQHSMLFSELTVWEHLMFFAMSKGCSFAEARKEGQDLLIKLELGSKKNELAPKLSGGMKRKLSLAMALVGKSKILILDEPTSGMDPESRRQLWDLLLSMRGQRTILLTTHYMEEADVLGDRIAIMDHGKVKCYGTSLFLKKVYGTGYHLKLLVDSNANKRSAIQELSSKVTALVKQLVPGAIVGVHSGDELVYTLPTNSADSFPSLFVQLDQQGKILGIVGLSLSVTTLEEVFLTVGKLDEAEDKVYGSQLELGAVDSSTSRSIREAINTEKVSGIHLVMQQAEALFLKKLQFAKATWIQLLLQCVFGMVLVLLAMKNTIPTFSIHVEPPLKFSISDYKYSYAFTSGNGLTGLQAEDIYMKLLSKEGTSIKNVTWNRVADALLEAGQKDEAAYRDDYIVSATFDDVNVTSYFSTVLYHSCPTSLNLVTTTLLRLLTNSSRSIITTVHPFPDEIFLSFMSGAIAMYMNAITWLAMVPVGLLILTSAFMTLPILEGASGARHLQLMALSSSMSLFWIVSLLFDMALYIACVLVALIVFPIISGGYTYGIDFNCALFVTFLLFGFGAMPFSYLISYFKKTIGSGLSFYTNVSLFLGWQIGIVVIVMEELLDIPALTYLLHIVCLCIPHFSLTLGLKKFSMITSYNSRCSTIPTHIKEKLCSLVEMSERHIDISCCDNLCNIIGKCFKPISYFGWGSFTTTVSSKKEEPEGMGIELLTLALLCPFYLGILYFIDKGILSNTFEKLVEILKLKLWKESKDELNTNVEDEDVFKEKDRLDFLLQSGYKQKGKDTLIAHRLKKNYGWFRWLRGGQVAVKDISFGVDSGDCFGLLGANGAGKTSTFGIITGSHPPSSGRSYVLGERSSDWKGKNTKYQAYIGYCPQFNATLGVLTGRQMLRLYACLRGVPKNTVDEEVQRWLDHLDLNEPADRPCKNYSGGNHRRLNTAMSLMGECPLICLDEPTAGVDPVARRKMWDVLISARSNGAAIVLTSHSMEECEALCTKLAIIVNGQFVCIGTVPYLKQKFGQGFTLLVKLSTSVDTSEENIPRVGNLKEQIETKFDPCTIKDEHQGLLHYHIINPLAKWDFLFSTMEDLKRSHFPLIEDYSISDTTLEQVFLSFVRAQKKDLLEND